MPKGDKADMPYLYLNIPLSIPLPFVRVFAACTVLSWFGICEPPSATVIGIGGLVYQWILVPNASSIDWEDPHAVDTGKYLGSYLTVAIGVGMAYLVSIFTL